MKPLNYLFIFITYVTIAQSNFTLKGHISDSAEKEIYLKKYDFQGLSLLSQTKSDKTGNFTLEYPESYTGAALLEIKDSKSVIILLNKENIEIEWKNLNDYATLIFYHSLENNSFNKGIELYSTTEYKRKGLKYLIPSYKNEPDKMKFFATELKLQETAMAQFLEDLPQNCYAKYYLKIRRLLADMNLTSTTYPNRISQNEKEFNAIDFADNRLINSGLYSELLETYVILMENYSEKQYEHLNNSIDSIVKNLKEYPSVKQNVAEFLFNVFEKRSLVKSSEYLALAMLSDDSCILDDKRQALFEQYRKMAIGNIAPTIDLTNSNKPAKNIALLKSKYKLIVFGASWCPKCKEDIPKLKAFYTTWNKKNNLELLFVSLDSEESSFNAFVKDFPWLSICDYKSWEGKNVRNYYVFATPTMFLLDTNNKILLKPTSPEQISAWLENQ